METLRAVMLKLFAALECSDKELSILITDDREIQQLNCVYRSKDKATDVLSFSQQEGEPSHIQENMLGDVVVSLETAERQAAECDVDLQQEVIRLLLHGVLHLLGYDHENVSDEQAEEMRALERKLLPELVANI